MIEQIGRYRISGELGRGAMGIVYRAEDPAIGRTVAIKTIRLADLPDARERQRLRERILREAQSAGILSHPGIVTIYDIAEDGGLCHIFMEYVDGTTLERLIATGGLPDPAALLGIFRQTAAALDYAHKRGIVHRDVKPANIMVDAAGTAKVTDFGVARFVSHEMTQTGALMGTPSYMAPEQIQGHPVDGRADQYALAVIAYEALTGEKPFVADSLPALVYRIVRDDPPPAHRVNPTLNGGVDGVLRKAMSKDPVQRFASCADFIETLCGALASARGWKPLIPGISASLPTVAIPAPPAIAPPGTQARRPQPPPAAVQKGGSLAVGLLIGAFTVALVLGLIFALPKVIGRGSVAGSPAASVPTQSAAPPAAPQAAEDTRPSPMGPPAGAAEPSGGAAAQTPVSTATPAESSQEQTGQPQAEADPQSQPVETPAPVVPRPVPARSEEPAVLHTVRITADPPGSHIVVDGDNSLACTSPCTLDLFPGRHTLRARHDAYHDALKIFEVPRNSEVSFSLSQIAGQLIIRTNPPGASIYLNDKPQGRVTPAVLNVPAGRYRLTLIREGYPRQDDEIEVRDGAISNFEFNWVH